MYFDRYMYMYALYLKKMWYWCNMEQSQHDQHDLPINWHTMCNFMREKALTLIENTTHLQIHKIAQFGIYAHQTI